MDGGHGRVCGAYAAPVVPVVPLVPTVPVVPFRFGLPAAGAVD